MANSFQNTHQNIFSLCFCTTLCRGLIVLETIGVTSEGGGENPPETATTHPISTPAMPIDTKPVFSGSAWHDTPFYHIDKLEFGHTLTGPAIIIEENGTIVVEVNWQARITRHRHIVIERLAVNTDANALSVENDPVTLEIFNNLFMSIAQQMGIVLGNTSQSVNIKERLDFSCAIFDENGSLIENAPHVPAHLGSMDSSVKVVINSAQQINPRDVYVQNTPYNGGSHLPDMR